MDVNLIVLEAAPETLNDDVVRGTAFTVHADSNLVLLQQIDILWTRKMTALVAVDNHRLTPRQYSIHGLQNEPDLQALVKLPIDDITGVPVHDGVQVHPAVLHPNVRNIHRPDLIGLYFWQPPGVGTDRSGAEDRACLGSVPDRSP